MKVKRLGIVATIGLAALVGPAGHAAATSGKGQAGCEPYVFSVAPPPGFDPLKATPSELACYGFPSRPSGDRALAVWTRSMEHAKQYVRPVFGTPRTRPGGDLRVRSGGVQTNTVAQTWNTNASYPWAGYDIPRSLNGWSNRQWNEVEGEWNVPYGHTFCTEAGTSPWVGIGGDGWDPGGNRYALIQGGTDTYNESPTPATQFWWEDYNFNSEVPITNMTVHQGDDVIVDAHYNGNTYTNFFYQNLTNNSYTTWGNRHTPNVDLSSADFIVEDQPSPDFVNFGTVPFTYSVAFGTWGSGYAIQKDVSQASIAQFNLYNSAGHLIASPGPVASLGVFNVSSTSYAQC